MKVFAGPSAGYQGFNFRIGPGGHPALRNKLIRRAFAHAIDRAALVREVPGQINLTCDRSKACSSSSRARITDRIGASTHIAPRSPLACSSRRAVGEAPTASTRAPASGSRFASSRAPATLTELGSFRSCKRSSDDLASRWCRSSLPLRTFLGTILPSGDFDVALFGIFERSESDRKRRLRMRGQPELQRYANGW